MTFTTPCFVRVEDAAERQKLIEWLRSVGHTVYPYCAYEEWHTLVCDPIAGFDLLDVAVTRDDDAILKERDLYDCGTSVDLFKALAAMNNENDLEQWFVVKKPISDFYDIDDVVYQKGDMFFNDSGQQKLPKDKFRKATAEEIVEYFTKRENDYRTIRHYHKGNQGADRI